jgi:hypothetical protein
MNNYFCIECGKEDNNPHSTSLCRDCQIKELMALLDDCEKTERNDESIERLSDSTVLYVGGSKSSFHCECHCNVFHKIKYKNEEFWECNACETWYKEEE